MYFLGGADPYSLEGNLAVTVDKALVGENHLYKGFGLPFDPEGLLSTIPAVGTVLLGFMAGTIIGSFGNSWKTVGWLALAGAHCLQEPVCCVGREPSRSTNRYLDQLIRPLCRRYRNDGAGTALHDCRYMGA
ncbi:MAG: hypothetical protein MZV63_03830 [Marinilabiliales bacterium]|nr:hypothetical protein [Marinilabiliales bacterium]